MPHSSLRAAITPARRGTGKLSAADVNSTEDQRSGARDACIAREKAAPLSP
jgi:hypothetical protein